MNYTIMTADIATRMKIVLVALVGRLPSRGLALQSADI